MDKATNGGCCLLMGGILGLYCRQGERGEGRLAPQPGMQAFLTAWFTNVIPSSGAHGWGLTQELSNHSWRGQGKSGLPAGAYHDDVASELRAPSWKKVVVVPKAKEMLKISRFAT